MTIVPPSTALHPGGRPKMTAVAPSGMTQTPACASHRPREAVPPGVDKPARSPLFPTSDNWTILNSVELSVSPAMDLRQVSCGFS
ncbi:putative type II inositol polyphosphate 5-phosphatase 15 [Iris pallida]|uniref:Type II inositol polyphosphate 5-phosphatase 15 n=1 Tax=Iris pallida TaxID=29817 RepID=A0AAX6GCE2_IRIPA|nr:putative type II inositol polyphosphate 5-phosphatase 15 [Iris pallida]